MNIDLIKEILGKKVNITRQVSDIFFNLKGETWPDRPIRSNTKDEEFKRIRTEAIDPTEEHKTKEDNCWSKSRILKSKELRNITKTRRSPKT